MATYFVNTDAKSNDGRSYHDKWLERGVAVTSGPQKFRDKLARIRHGDTVLAYVDRTGVVAAGTALNDEVADVRGEHSVVSPREPIEYHKQVEWHSDLRSAPLSLATLRDLCGRPPRQTVERVRKGEAQLAQLIEQRSDASPADSEPTSDSAEYVIRADRLLRRGRIARPAGVLKPVAVQGATALFCRDPAVRAWVLHRADGRCELCGTLAPFVTDRQARYLESHHVIMLAEGGPDTPDNTAALCPNCHRNLHYGSDRANLRERLGGLVAGKEADGTHPLRQTRLTRRSIGPRA
jgi:5-methylcytosine-specific restriction endonuclease McrA